jgi:hypothetical protein
VYAHVLAALGDPAGAEELIEWVRANDWDTKWQEGLGAGECRMEAYLFALGRARSKQAVPVLAEKIGELADGRKQAAPSRCRVVVRAAQMLGDPALAEPLAKLLQAPGIGGHTIRMGPEIPPVPGYNSRSSYSQQEKSDATREVNLAATLYRLGDHQGAGEAVLRAYAEDPRGFYAHYSRRVLDEGK